MLRRPGHWHRLNAAAAGSLSLVRVFYCQMHCVFYADGICICRNRIDFNAKVSVSSVLEIGQRHLPFSIFDDGQVLCLDPPPPTTHCQWQHRRCSVRAFVWSPGLRHTRQVWRSGKQKDGSDNDNNGSNDDDHDIAAAVKFLKPNLN